MQVCEFIILLITVILTLNNCTMEAHEVEQHILLRITTDQDLRLHHGVHLGEDGREFRVKYNITFDILLYYSSLSCPFQIFFD